MMKHDHNQIYDENIVPPHSILSHKPYTEKDIIETNYILDLFIKDKFYEINDQNQTQNSCLDYNQVLKKLSTIIDNWIMQVALKNGFNENTAKNQKAYLIPFGSHKLGVNWINGDIDSIVVSPQYVDREKNFFGDLVEILRKDTNIEELLSIKEAYVPVIKMKFHKVSIDLLFARLDLSKWDGKLDTLDDDMIFSSMDAEMIRSINGCRVSNKILELIEDKESFRATLKLVKVWAKNKGIYSNITGFLGGVSWALMVAKICQLFPFLKPNKLLSNFFRIYSNWNWSDYPVLIEDLKETPYANRQIPEKQWNESDTSSMTIITPVFPCKNSSYNVSSITLSIIKFHLQRAWIKISEDLELNKKINWEKIFKKFNFFKKFRHFFEINIGADDSESFVWWKSFVESKLKYFTKSFEYFDYEHKFDLYPYPVPFDTSDTQSKFSISYYFGIKLKPVLEQMECSVNFWHVAREFLDQIVPANKKKSMTLKIQHILRENLSLSVYSPEPKFQYSEEQVQSRMINLNGNINPKNTNNNTYHNDKEKEAPKGELNTKILSDLIMGKTQPPFNIPSPINNINLYNNNPPNLTVIHNSLSPAMNVLNPYLNNPNLNGMPAFDLNNSINTNTNTNNNSATNACFGNNNEDRNKQENENQRNQDFCSIKMSYNIAKLLILGLFLLLSIEVQKIKISFFVNLFYFLFEKYDEFKVFVQLLQVLLLQKLFQIFFQKNG